MNTVLVEQETTREQEMALLLERFRAAKKRNANSETDDSETVVIATRYNALAHPEYKRSRQ